MKLVYLLLLPLLSACATVPRYPAVGIVADQVVSTTLDSKAAKYYLEHYLQDEPRDPAMERALDSQLPPLSEKPLQRGTLQRLTRRFSTDLATLYFVARLYQQPANRRLQQAFHTWVERLATRTALPVSGVQSDYLFVFVPGYAYRLDPATGADFARQRHILKAAGFQTHLIETGELAKVEPNAAIITRELKALARTYDKLIVVSTSKGGPEVALSLGQQLPQEVAHRIKAWISVGGMLRGSPLADQALQWPRSWWARLAFAWYGLDADVIHNLSTPVRTNALESLQFPSHLMLLHYIGVPLSGHIQDYNRSRYEDLKPLGPNDGLTLLVDQLLPGGRAITDIGLDHYYLDPRIGLKTLALAYVVLDQLASKLHDKKSMDNG